MQLAAADNHAVPSLEDDSDFLSVVAGADLLDRARRIAGKGKGAVLIEGETGTGKTALAHWIHRHSDRAGKPFTKRGCGELDTGTGSSALFGHIRGAFTGALSARKGSFQQADGGTLLLDDIDYLSLELQASLLRFLDDGQFTPLGEDQERSSDVRVIATTNKDLDKRVEAGLFLTDLRARLRQWRIRLTPLRQSPEATRRLAAYYLRQEAAEEPQASFRPDALDLLASFNWPENIRQLRSVVTNAALHITSRRTMLGVDEVMEAVEQLCPELRLRTAGDTGPGEPEIEEQALRALRLTGFNVAKAARLLRCSRPALYRIIERRGWRP